MILDENCRIPAKGVPSSQYCERDRPSLQETMFQENGYKIAKAYMMQCYSAYKGVTPKPDVRRVDFGAMWRSVSVRFFGYVGENVLLLDVVPSRRRRRRGGRRR